MTQPTSVIAKQPITPSASHKYISVILDQELQFKEHVAYALGKGQFWAAQLWRLLKPMQGMPLRFFCQLYLLVTVSHILYAADIWCAPTLTSTKNGRRPSQHVWKLIGVQRLVTMQSLGALRSTATDLLDAHADLLPIDLLVDQIVMHSMLRLVTLHPSNPMCAVAKKTARRLVKQHCTALHHTFQIFSVDPDQTETINPTRLSPNWEPRVHIAPSAKKVVEEAESCQDGHKIWMDGSLIDGGVGAAAVLEKNDEHKAVLRKYLGSGTEHIVFDGENISLALELELV
ncbi:predicted protein [Postia placenta Mad-698-R]|uniref:RNase H type-1 domain-containing protein n=1 Tax=Postia placenta MAD-698-R-SB12 TaxID=670580 RepID=A0A1X6MMM8_9APHY|nr:hypothetical protein POSPLADRAFT_1036844 [Postia placenta MAD-698-R-SB12]EED81350.1 predicted protein [Postia placenta Mad-698-R]OSX57333.1 hypothetical protein POSPLADRAFT_1036844 [Postia placenta MAD-698-R-SB12]